MEVKLIEAFNDENKKSKGGNAGDQLNDIPGRGEVRIGSWRNRSGGWDVCLECTDPALGRKAASIFRRIANDSSFGYDQDQRWTALEAILKASGNIEAAADSELDCSSGIDMSYILAGLKVDRGYTGNLERRYLATGKFIAHREPEYLTSGSLAKSGWLYLATGKHVAMALIEDEIVDEVIQDQEEEPTVDPIPDNVNWENASVVVNKINDWCNVRAYPSASSAIVGKAFKNEIYKACDFDGVFFMIMYNGTEAFIHGSLVTLVQGSQEEPTEAKPKFVRVTYRSSRGAPGTVAVRKVPRVGKAVYIAFTGEQFEVIGKETNGFLLVKTPKGQGYITTDKKYTEVIFG